MGKKCGHFLMKRIMALQWKTMGTEDALHLLEKVWESLLFMIGEMAQLPKLLIAF